MNELAIFDNFFSNFFFDKPHRAVTPSLSKKDVRVCKNEDETRLSIDLPGFPPEGVEVITEGKVLSVVAQTNAEEQNSIQRKFTRSWSLPAEVDTEQINASLKHGVLEIILPKAARAAPKRIEITS